MVCGLAFRWAMSRFAKNDWHSGEKSGVDFMTPLLSSELQGVRLPRPLIPECCSDTNKSLSHCCGLNTWRGLAFAASPPRRYDTNVATFPRQNDGEDRADVVRAAHRAVVDRFAVRGGERPGSLRYCSNVYRGSPRRSRPRADHDVHRFHRVTWRNSTALHESRDVAAPSVTYQTSFVGSLGCLRRDPRPWPRDSALHPAVAQRLRAVRTNNNRYADVTGAATP